ncbi:MAG: M1 family aminopeptidase [Bacteroidota bacterium]
MKDEKLIQALPGAKGFMLIPLFFACLSLQAQKYCSHHFNNEYIVSSVSPAYSLLQNCYDVKYYNLELEASDTSTYIKGNTKILFEAVEEIDSLVFELKQSMEIDSVFLNEVYVPEYFHKSGLLYVLPSEPLPSASQNSLRVVYSGGATGGGFFTGLTNRRDVGYGKAVTYTLSEPFQSSSWFPVKQNLLDKADSVSVRVITDSTLMAGSNGLLTKELLPDGKMSYNWHSGYPIAFYLISIAVADYIDYSFYVHLEGTEDSLLVQNFIYDHPEIFKNEKERIDNTADMLQLFSDLFGDYPFNREKYGHSMAPMGGGMEHQTMTTLQTFNFDLVAHELAHQWFGNNVTCGTWQDIWINEGFASYSEYLARESLLGFSEAVEWMENAHTIALNSRNESIYLTEEEAKQVGRIFSFPLSYKKGAAILHMLRNEINNDTLFFQSFRDFQIQYKDSVARGEDFLKTVNSVTGEDYSWFFDQWYYGKGFPVVQAIWKARADSLYLEVLQGGSHNENDVFRMHMDFRIQYSDGTDTLIRVRIDKPENSFSIRLEKEFENIQIDPYSKILMTSTQYEYIPEDKEIEVSPNPFQANIYLNFRNPNSLKSVRITNLNGQVLVDKELGDVGSATLDLSKLAEGLYLMVIKDGNATNAMRIAKLL